MASLRLDIALDCATCKTGRHDDAETYGPPALSALLCGKVSTVDRYRSDAKGVNADYDMARVAIDLKLPEDMKLYRMLKKLAT
jgi:hypothetical protein